MDCENCRDHPYDHAFATFALAFHLFHPLHKHAICPSKRLNIYPNAFAAWLYFIKAQHAIIVCIHAL